MSNDALNAARAALGQGLAMGWGDEAEAWLSSRLQDKDYEKELSRIRQEYGQYSKENPYMSGALEFAGGVAPGVAAMFVPGGQAIGAQQLARTATGALARAAASPLARAIAAGATTGGIAGAGSAKEGERLSGAGSGALLGGAIGAATPIAMRAGRTGASWLREKLAPSEQLFERRAAEKVTEALRESDMTPQEIKMRIEADRSLGVPSVVANIDPALSDLAETVAQRTGRGTREIEKKLGEQKAGARERAYQQVAKQLNPRDYYADEQRMVENLRAKAAPAYEAAYSKGAVDDPVINTILTHPTFQAAYARGRGIAESQAMAAKLRGEDPSKYTLPELYKPTGATDTLTNTPVMELTAVPDVRTLDYVKRGLDDLIDAGYKGTSSVGKGQSSALRDLRNQFVAAIDRNVPEYRDVRKMYAGDMEVLDAMRTGYNDFGRLDPEQISSMVSKMSDAEKDAFRTGVARDLYGKIMDPSTNFNAAQRIIGSKTTREKLQPLFDSPEQFDIFKNAMERESQLFHQANKILGGSQTGKRSQMAKEFDSESGAGEAIAQAITGGFWSSLTGMAARAVRSGRMGSQTAQKVANMLMSKDPNEVAAVVKTLENYATEAAPRAARATAAEMGATTGGATSIYSPPSPPVTEEETNIETPEVPVGMLISGPDIEADIEAALRSK